MDNYMMALICRALINISGDLAVETQKDPDKIIVEALMDASLQVQKFGEKEVIASIKRHNQYLYDKAFVPGQGGKEL